MLSIMGACTQRQVQRMLFVYEAHAGSTLQNFDALLRTDHLSQEAEFRPRAILLVLFLLPLGLSASYKRFIGGSTTVQVPSVGGWYGMTAAPGYQRIGNGLSLLVNIYLPFWVDPANTNGTYGFNLFVPNGTVAAVLDAPLPTSLLQLQASLKGDESFEVSAEVDATVSELNSIAPSERDNATSWQDLENSFSNGFEDTSPSDLQSGAFTQMYTGFGDSNASYTEIYVSFYNITRNESFKSTAERYSQTRRKCHAAWNVTRTSILLNNATILQTGEEAKASEYQGLSFKYPLVLSMFSKFLGEYAPTIRARWPDPLPYSNFTNPQYIPPVNTIPPLIAAMLWARIVSAYGAERSVFTPLRLRILQGPESDHNAERGCDCKEECLVDFYSGYPPCTDDHGRADQSSAVHHPDRGRIWSGFLTCGYQTREPCSPSWGCAEWGAGEACESEIFCKEYGGTGV